MAKSELFCGTGSVHKPHEWIGDGYGAMCPGLTADQLMTPEETAEWRKARQGCD
jgi:hypothetical protein